MEEGWLGVRSSVEHDEHEKKRKRKRKKRKRMKSLPEDFALDEGRGLNSIGSVECTLVAGVGQVCICNERLVGGSC